MSPLQSKVSEGLVYAKEYLSKPENLKEIAEWAKTLSEAKREFDKHKAKKEN